MAQATKKQGTGARKTGSASTYAPNQSLYISNLPTSKIQKPDLRTALYILFSTYGPVLDVVALRTEKMRGQAHIVFRDIQAATQAMRALQGFEFFGKELQISYAKAKSDTIAKLDGTYRMPSSATAAVETTDLQKSVFQILPSSAAAIASLPPIPPAPASLKVPQVADTAMEDAKSPAMSVAGQKRRRDDDDNVPDEDSEEDVAMDEDSDDD